MTKKEVVLAGNESRRDFLIFLNHTSSQEFVEYRKTKITQFDEKEISFVVPVGKCASGHSLTLFIFESEKGVKVYKKIPKDKSAMKCLIVSGPISEAHMLDKEGFMEVTLRVTNYDKDSWDRYLGRYDGFQDQFNRILESMKE